MLDKVVNGASVLRLYIWYLMQENLDWNSETYNGLIPITPNGQDPDLVAMGEPYMVYGFVEHGYEEIYHITEGFMTLNIYVNTTRELNEILTVLKEVFKKKDDAAAAINRFSSNYEKFDLGGIRFTNTNISVTDSGEPPEREGEMLSATVTINYNCITEYSDITM